MKALIKTNNIKQKHSVSLSLNFRRYIVKSRNLSVECLLLFNYGMHNVAIEKL